ncbi:MAG: hypothetical protein ABWY35_11840 [Pseudorhodoplanes sp.]
MNFFESFVPSGDLDQRPYLRSLIALAIGAVLSHMLTAPAVTSRIGILPFVITQLAILWWWYALIMKRMRNAERSFLGVTAVSLIDLFALLLLSVMLLLQFSDTSAGAAAPYLPASISLLIYPFVFLFNLVTGPAANSQDLQVALLALAVVAPVVLTIFYSLWAAAQPSALHAHD